MLIFLNLLCHFRSFYQYILVTSHVFFVSFCSVTLISLDTNYINTHNFFIVGGKLFPKSVKTLWV